MSQVASVPRERIDALRAFNRFYTRKIGVLGSGLLDSRYPLTEVRVLYEIAHRDRPLAADLVRELELDAGYLSRILATFDRRGWLKRTPCTSDARKTYLSLTAKGRKASAELERRSRDYVAELLAPLDPDRQLSLQVHLLQVQALLEPGERAVPDLTLRQHRAGDIGWIVQRHGAIYAAEYGFDCEFEALVAEICAGFLRNYDPQRERCWIAERGGVPVGTIMLVRHSEEIAKLRLLLVEASERGRGVGRTLVSECVHFARATGYRTLTLWTQSILATARRTYEAHGFRLVESKPHRSFGVDLIGETWELDLHASQ
jgi:DNA-binding MarR family transcriptional regulator/GNAT superfamily N-acetyltransferase